MAERLAEQPEQFVQVMAQRRARLIRAPVSEPMDGCFFSGHFHCDRRVCSYHSVLFFGGLDAVLASFGISLVAHFAVGALNR